MNFTLPRQASSFKTPSIQSQWRPQDVTVYARKDGPTRLVLVNRPVASTNYGNHKKIRVTP
jgi:hypothetical protein